MKYNIVLVPFPFDDLSSQKVRPAVCLTNKINKYDHVVLAFITSRISQSPSDTDYIVDSNAEDFSLTGLKVSSTIILHRLITVSNDIIKRKLGGLSIDQQKEIENRLRILFELQ